MPEKRKNNPLKTRFNGFSLVESIVVAGVIGILLIQAGSALSDISRDSRKFSCLEKLGKIGTASLVYASTDSNEYVIPIGPMDANSRSSMFANYGYGGKGGAGYRNSVDPNRSEWGGSTQMGAVHRPLNRILYKNPIPTPAPVDGRPDWTQDSRQDLDIYHCPGDNGFPGMHHLGWRNSGLSSYNHFGTSYMASIKLIYDPLAPENMFSTSTYSRPLSTVPVPSETVTYLENSGRFAHSSYDPELPNQVLNSECRDFYFEEDGYVARGWHDQPWRFNVAFADGHAENVRIRSYAEQSGSPLAPGCGRDNQRCVCVIIRGEGWRYDTLPASLIKTQKPGSSGGGSSTIYGVVP